MKQIDASYIRQSFSGESALQSYTDAVDHVGLWESEKLYFTKYFDPNGRILDVGCGAGRTTFGLYGLGFCNIEGLDITPEMVDHASQLAAQKALPIRFVVGDATALQYPDASFDHALFSFNGFMQIPGRSSRVQALREIKRVLKPCGTFIFTTHDRLEPEYADFWGAEALRWQSAQQDERLHEFGDAIITADGRETYIHFPTPIEVISCINESGFTLVDYAHRSAVCDESDAVKVFSTDCIFWVVSRP